MPRVALRAELKGVIEQPLHVLAIEFLSARYVKVRADVRQVEMRSILLRHAVDSLQVADPLGLNQCTDGSAADAQCTALGPGPLRPPRPVANDIEMTFETQGYASGPVEPHERARWVKKHLSDDPAVHVHFMKLLAIDLHIDHHG